MSKHKEVNSLIEGLFKEVTLRELFQKRIYELNISQNAAEKMLQVGHKPLLGLLDGTQKKVDYMVLNKVSTFLGLAVEEVIEIHLRQLESNFDLLNTTTNKKKFIKENFDLIDLRKA
jgi:HTH-type transcriptional regulator/antitoxin HigA